MSNKPAPTTPANLKRIGAFYDKLQDLMLQLSSRWADECEYEDIDDYKKAIEKHLPAGFTIERMLKRPFGFTFRIGTPALYSLTCGRTYEWKRIG